MSGLWGLDLSLRLSFEALQSRLEKEKKTEHATQEKYLQLHGHSLNELFNRRFPNCRTEITASTPEQHDNSGR